MSYTKTDSKETGAERAETLSVSGQIFKHFVDMLAEKPEFEEVAARLWVTVIDEKKTSEAMLRRALFGEDEG